jgi:hypothetical protein
MYYPGLENESIYGPHNPYRASTANFLGVGTNSGATSTGPYPANSALGSAVQTNRFNLDQFGTVEDLTNRLNTLNRNAQASALKARIPNASGLEEQSSDNIGSELKGEVPADVMQRLAQSAAERGVSSGISADSPNGNAAYLRALGLTSLDLTGKGQQELNAAYARNPAAPLYDPSGLIITPYQGAEMAYQGGQQNLAATVAFNRNANGGVPQQHYNYGQPTTQTGTNGFSPYLTAADLFGDGGTDLATSSPSGTGSTWSNTYTEPFSSNYYDYGDTTQPYNYGDMESAYG